MIKRACCALLVMGAIFASPVPAEAQHDAIVVAARSCGHVRAQGSRFHVTVERGRVGCRTARKVLRAFFSGEGHMHGPKNGPSARQYWTLYGWGCGYGTGGGACTRKSDHAYILGQA
jgi:hypothetical protein